MSPHPRWIGLTWNRRLTLDLLHFGKKIPAVTAHREMCLAPLDQARKAGPHKPSWSVLFTKAFALTALEHPELRRSYVPLPWGHLYEHPQSVAFVTAERNDGPEPYPLPLRLRGPEHKSLLELDEKVRHFKTAPLQELHGFRKIRAFARAPWPIRRAVWWCTLNLWGPLRARHGGTFAVSSVSSLGAGLLNLISPTTSNLHFGVMNDSHRLEVRLTFDHRVYDGGQAARALQRLEEILNGQMVAELLGAPACAPACAAA